MLRIDSGAELNRRHNALDKREVMGERGQKTEPKINSKNKDKQ